MLGVILLTLTCAAVGCLLVGWFYHRRVIDSHPIEAIPGPRAVPFFGNILSLLGPIEETFKKLHAIALNNYPIFRLWQGPVPTIFVLGPKYTETITSSTVHINKSFDYNFLKEWLGNGLVISSGSKWHGRRKLLTPAFHFSILEQFVPVFSDKTAILVNKLRGHVNQTVNMVPLVTRCALDIICETAMGTNVDAQGNFDSPYVTAVHEINELLIYRLARPWLWPKFLYKLTPGGQKFYHCIKLLHEFTFKVIRDRREERKNLQKLKENPGNNIGDTGTVRKKFALLDLLLATSEEHNTLSDEDIREEVDTFMFEGHDTTAAAINWALLFIGAHENIQEQCVLELGEIFSGSDRTPTLADLGSMKYLERVIKETLRIRPSVGIIGRQLTQEFKFGEYNMPVGTKFGIPIASIHHMPQLYPEPDIFDPDRFLPDNSITRHPYAYIPFSAGPRNCIGQKFAMLEMKTVLSTLLRHFRFETVDFERDYQTIPDVILRPKYGITLKIYSREV